ncbi:hypothetical protein GOARA_056_01770 [Gordonia araii NBRC 100433]|uniref:Uncharacterized protein n=1 Tax=Gordonia araii NBRC 100433 TaxID=1073574 RepID=G7H3K4_9ACTN|nr:hypothetical protein [Gordonia araii]NNG96546.1 hypothetical protein [Gordonia araii NBRC 100433]GAB10429.1 hypothetical protein GOARA_056_01770 [Gordonia araii NBRC 100433]
MNRTANVIRMQLVNRQTFVWLPATILGAAFAITLAIYGVVVYTAGSADEPMYSGGTQAPLWYFGVVGVQALTLTFPFSQAMSVTRREFFLGTLLTAAASAGVLALVYLVGGILEQATDGWGFGGYFFYLPWVWEQGPIVAALTFFSAAALAFLVGFGSATVYKRFGMFGVILVGVVLAAALIGTAFAVSAVDGWPAIGRALAAAQPLTVAGICLAVSAAVAGLSYAALRRAIP